MQIVIDIPEEQVKKSLEESKYIHEDEGEKGFVNIALLYTNGQLDFVDVSRKTDFYSCKYKILPKGHGRLIDVKDLTPDADYEDGIFGAVSCQQIVEAEAIIEADEEENEETETWNGIHGQITAPKGTFEQIFNDTDDDNDI